MVKKIDIEKENREILNKYRALLRACKDKTNTKDKKDIPEGKLHSELAILSWDKKQEMQKRVCLYCDAWGTFAIQPQDAYKQFYFLCGDHYSSEKTEKIKANS